MHVQSCCFAYKTYCFLSFSLPSASLDFKFPNGKHLDVAQRSPQIKFDSVFRFRFRFPCFNAVVSRASSL